MILITYTVGNEKETKEREVMIFSIDNGQFSDFPPASSKRDDLFLKSKITFIWGG